jgi:hypothetical protein
MVVQLFALRESVEYGFDLELVDCSIQRRNKDLLDEDMAGIGAVAISSECVEQDTLELRSEQVYKEGK